MEIAAISEQRLRTSADPGMFLCIFEDLVPTEAVTAYESLIQVSTSDNTQDEDLARELVWIRYVIKQQTRVIQILRQLSGAPS